MGRKLGSRNKVTASVRATVTRLVRGGTLNLERCFTALQSIVDDSAQPAMARIAAARELFNRAFGLPHAAIDLQTTHELGESAVDLLYRIHQSDSHRRNLEDDELQRALTTSLET